MLHIVDNAYLHCQYSLNFGLAEVSYVDDGYNYETETIVGRTSEYIPPQPIKKFIYTRSGTPFYPIGGI